eukprot:9920279-Ditylum_brightwellii.AAC.1
MTQTTERECLLCETHDLLKEVSQVQYLAGEQCTHVELAATYHNLGIVLSKLGGVRHNENGLDLDSTPIQDTLDSSSM